MINKYISGKVIRNFVLMFFVGTILLMSTGCNTVHGFGKDVQIFGEKIQGNPKGKNQTINGVGQDVQKLGEKIQEKSQ